MVEVETDLRQSLLTIRFAGHVSAEQAKDSLEEVKAALDGLNPGFRLLTDLSRLESMDVACAVYIRRNMDWCNKRGVSKVVRVIPDPKKDIGLSIMSLFHYHKKIQIITCETLPEAMTALSA